MKHVTNFTTSVARKFFLMQVVQSKSVIMADIVVTAFVARIGRVVIFVNF